jgi:hypothetical protein
MSWPSFCHSSVVKFGSNLNGVSSMADSKDEQYSSEETAQRLERGLRRALNMPHKTQVESSQKKRRAARKGRVRKGKSRR